MFNSISVTGALKLLGVNPRVYEVGETGQEPINFRDATAVAGAAIFWRMTDSSSPLVSLAGMVVGVVETLFAYDIGVVAYKLYGKWSHRVAAPLNMDEESEEYKIVLKRAFEKLKLHPFYVAYTILGKGFESDEALFSILSDRMKKGFCFGMVTVLFQRIAANPNDSCNELLKSVDFSQVFYFQLEEGMRALFEGVKERSQERCLRYQELVGENRAHLDKWLDTEVATQRMRLMINDFKNTMAWNEVESELFSVKESFPAFCSNLERVQNQSVDRSLVGRILIRGDSEDQKRKGYKGGHALLIQCSPGRYRYYDSIDEITGGFFEYKDKQEFYAALRYQLLNDIYDCNNPLVSLSIKKLE